MKTSGSLITLMFTCMPIVQCSNEVFPYGIGPYAPWNAPGFGNPSLYGPGPYPLTGVATYPLSGIGPYPPGPYGAPAWPYPYPYPGYGWGFPVLNEASNSNAAAFRASNGFASNQGHNDAVAMGNNHVNNLNYENVVKLRKNEGHNEFKRASHGDASSVKSDNDLHQKVASNQASKRVGPVLPPL